MNVHVGVAKNASGRRCLRCGRPLTERHHDRCPAAQIELIPHCDYCGKSQGEHYENCPRWWKPRGNR